MTAVCITPLKELLKLPQVECPLEHHFCDGVYARQITMPANTFIVGKRHKTAHFNIILKGKAKVLIDGVVSIIEAPCILNSNIDVRKVLFIIEEMTWVTIHPTTETNIEILEKHLVHDMCDLDMITNDDILLLSEVSQ